MKWAYKVNWVYLKRWRCKEKVLSHWKEKLFVGEYQQKKKKLLVAVREAGEKGREYSHNSHFFRQIVHFANLWWWKRKKNELVEVKSKVSKQGV